MDGTIAYVLPMRLLSIATMMLAWLAYGTMFAWAGCPMCASMNQPAAADMSTGMSHQAMADMEMGDSIKVPASAQSPCEGGGMTSTLFESMTH